MKTIQIITVAAIATTYLGSIPAHAKTSIKQTTVQQDGQQSPKDCKECYPPNRSPFYVQRTPHSEHTGYVQTDQVEAPVSQQKEETSKDEKQSVTMKFTGVRAAVLKSDLGGVAGIGIASKSLEASDNNLHLRNIGIMGFQRISNPNDDTSTDEKFRSFEAFGAGSDYYGLGIFYGGVNSAVNLHVADGGPRDPATQPYTHDKISVRTGVEAGLKLGQKGFEESGYPLALIGFAVDGIAQENLENPDFDPNTLGRMYGTVKTFTVLGDLDKGRNTLVTSDVKIGQYMSENEDGDRAFVSGELGVTRPKWALSLGYEADAQGNGQDREGRGYVSLSINPFRAKNVTKQRFR